MSATIKELLQEISSYFVAGTKMKNVVLALASEDFGEFKTSVEFPNRLGRAWDNPEFQEELAACRKQYQEDLQNFRDKFQYEHVSLEGGGEGGTERVEGIFKLMGKYYSANWRYYSHHGYEYDYIEDSIYEVKPVQKTITVYEGV